MVDKLNAIEQDTQEIITLEHVRKLSKHLKKLSSKWVQDLAYEMYGSDEDYEEGNAKTKVYNITNNVTRSQDVRAKFVEKALALKDAYEKRMNSIRNSAEAI